MPKTAAPPSALLLEPPLGAPMAVTLAPPAAGATLLLTVLETPSEASSQTMTHAICRKMSASATP